MDFSNFASGEELFNAKNRNQVLPSRGAKESEVRGSWFEEKNVEARLQDRQEFISEIRLARKDQLASGRWLRSSKMVQLLNQTGTFWEYMGVETDIGRCLYPEEALYLIEMGELEVLDGGMSLSVQCAQAVMLLDQYHYQQYLVYAHLARAGCKVVRHQPHLVFTKYEKQIRLDQHQVKKKKRKLQLRDDQSKFNCDDDVSKNVSPVVSCTSQMKDIDKDSKGNLDDAIKDFYSILDDDDGNISESVSDFSQARCLSDLTKDDDKGNPSDVVDLTEETDYEKKWSDYLNMFPSMLGMDNQIVEPENLDLYPKNSVPQKKVYRISLQIMNYYSKYLDDNNEHQQSNLRNSGRGSKGFGYRYEKKNHKARSFVSFVREGDHGHHSNNASDMNISNRHSVRRGNDTGWQNEVDHERKRLKFGLIDELNRNDNFSDGNSGYGIESQMKSFEERNIDHNPRQGFQRNQDTWNDRIVDDRCRQGFRSNEDTWKNTRSDDISSQGFRSNEDTWKNDRLDDTVRQDWRRNEDTWNTGRMDDLSQQGWKTNEDVWNNEQRNDPFRQDWGRNEDTWNNERKEDPSRQNWRRNNDAWNNERNDDLSRQDWKRNEDRWNSGRIDDTSRENWRKNEDTWNNGRMNNSRSNDIDQFDNQSCSRLYDERKNWQATNVQMYRRDMQNESRSMDETRWQSADRSSKVTRPDWHQHDDRWSCFDLQDEQHTHSSTPSYDEPVVDLSVTPNWKVKRRRKKQRDNYESYPSYLMKLPDVKSWKEYKRIVNSISEQSALTKGLGRALWRGPTTPLLRPTMASTLQNVLNECRIFNQVVQPDKNIACTRSLLTLHFDVYTSNMTYKKTSPSIPAKRITVIRDEAVPSLDQIGEVTKRFPDETPVVSAVVVSGDVRFYTLSPLTLPSPKLT